MVEVTNHAAERLRAAMNTDPAFGILGDVLLSDSYDYGTLSGPIAVLDEALANAMAEGYEYGLLAATQGMRDAHHAEADLVCRICGEK